MKFSDAKLIEALEKTGGLRAETARLLGVSRSAITQRIQKNPALMEAITDIEESRLDMAESALLKAIEAGKSWAIIFYLKCKGRSRGYCLDSVPKYEPMEYEICN